MSTIYGATINGKEVTAEVIAHREYRQYQHAFVYVPRLCLGVDILELCYEYFVNADAAIKRGQDCITAFGFQPSEPTVPMSAVKPLRESAARAIATICLLEDGLDEHWQTTVDGHYALLEMVASIRDYNDALAALAEKVKAANG